MDHADGLRKSRGSDDGGESREPGQGRRRKAIAHGSNPDSSCGRRQDGPVCQPPWATLTIAGHPNIVTKESTFTAGDGAQTVAALVTVSSGNENRRHVENYGNKK